MKFGKEADYGGIVSVPASSDLGELRRKAAKCQACPLFRNATQTVFGEGEAGVIVFIGEQPGDQEDKVGKPFVGPAGKYWIGPCKRSGSTVRNATSRMRSNISNGKRAASVVFTKSLTPGKLRRVARG